MDERYIREGFNHALARLNEESGEVIAAVGKLMRWGPDSYSPHVPVYERETNIEWVLREVADLEDAISRFKVEVEKMKDEPGWFLGNIEKRKKMVEELVDLAGIPTERNGLKR